ncbi:MAG: hypothetical protein V3W22_04805 [Thermoplasmata archaeon]
MAGENDEGKTELDFEDPRVKALIDERVMSETKREREEYNEALEAYQKEAGYTTHPAYQQLKSVIDAQGTPTVTDGVAPPAPGAPAPQGQNGFESWATKMGARMAANIKDPNTARFLTEEFTNLARNMVNSGVGSAKGAEENVRKDVEELRTTVQGQEGKAVVQNLYFLDTEIMPGVKMSNLQALGIMPTDVAQELQKYAPGHEKVVISSMIAMKQHEAVGALVKKDEEEAERLTGLGAPGPTRRLKLTIPDHTFGKRPSLSEISQGLGKQMGASEEEIDQKYAEVR